MNITPGVWSHCNLMHFSHHPTDSCCSGGTADVDVLNLDQPLLLFVSKLFLGSAEWSPVVLAKRLHPARGVGIFTTHIYSRGISIICISCVYVCVCVYAGVSENRKKSVYQFIIIYHNTSYYCDPHTHKHTCLDVCVCVRVYIYIYSYM